MFSRFSKNPIPTNYKKFKYRFVENETAKHVNPKLNKPICKDFFRPNTFINQEQEFTDIAFPINIEQKQKFILQINTDEWYW